MYMYIHLHMLKYIVIIKFQGISYIKSRLVLGALRCSLIVRLMMCILFVLLPISRRS